MARGVSTAARRVVSPVGTGDLRWDGLARDDPDLAAWSADRWLGAHASTRQRQRWPTRRRLTRRRRAPEPYLYVAPWSPPDDRELWNATALEGAQLPLAALLDARDQRAAALDFLRARIL